MFSISRFKDEISFLVDGNSLEHLHKSIPVIISEYCINLEEIFGITKFNSFDSNFK